jgi:hypothetical protein
MRNRSIGLPKNSGAMLPVRIIGSEKTKTGRTASAAKSKNRVFFILRILDILK